jgi:hypothetical protein
MDSRAVAQSIFWWVKHYVKFVHHSKMILVLFGERDQLQLLIEPAVLVRMNRMKGDCAIYTMLICALLDCFNVPWEIVTLAVDPEQPTIFSHVFPRVVLPDGRIALDASHGRYPGWSVPRSRRFREQAWNENGEPIMNRGSFQGLHGYEFRGMGQDDNEDAVIYSDSSSTVTPSAIDYSTSLPAPTTGSSLDQLAALSQTPQAAALTDGQWSALFSGTTPTSIPSSGTSMPSQSSAAWAGVAATLAKGGMTLAQIEAIQPGEVVLPNGTVVGSGGSASLSSSLSSVPSYVWLLGGVALVAMFMMKR